MAGGRPRTVSPPPEELEALGMELVEWIKNTPNVLHVSEWYSLEKFFTDNVWETMVKRKEFVGYYEQAKKIIGKQYLDKTSNVREGISQRWQRVYFKDLAEEEDDALQRKLDKELEQKKKLIDHQSKTDKADSLTPEQISQRKANIKNA